VKGIWMKDLERFQKTPQFKEIVRNMNFLPYWQAKGFPPGSRWQAKGFPPGSRGVGRKDFECGIYNSIGFALACGQ
jgi:hypothetical protein